MKTHPENSRKIVDRFLGKLGEPVSPAQLEGALSRVRERLEEPAAFEVHGAGPVAAVSIRWSAVAATIGVILVGGLAQLLFMKPITSQRVAKAVGGQIYLAGVRPLSPLSLLSSPIGAAQSIRTGADSGTIELNDGSRVEMSPQAELSVVPAVDGMSVKLSSGTVIVTAAKQRQGHLYVETRDIVVSVVGTVFSVSAETTGSRVSVIEGEVHVQQGTTQQTLLPGQQASTTPALGPMPVQTELKWSKSAGEFAALLEQSAPGAPAAAPSGQTPSRVIQGSVKLAGKQEGIAGVTITACPANAGAIRVGRVFGENAQADLAYRLRIRAQDGVVVTPQDGDPVIRNKTFFFALWDGATCANRTQVKTDANGRFQLQDLQPGEYAVRAEAEGYFGPAENGTYPAFASQMITVDPQQGTPEVSLSLTRGGTISGRIRDAEGKLAVNVPVWAGVAGAGDKFTTQASKTTDDRGEYRLFWLPPGEYYVGVGAQDSAAGRAGIVHYFNVGTPGAGQPAVTLRLAHGQVGFTPVQTVFPNGASISEGKTIVVREGEEVVGIDIMMRPTPPSDAPVTPPNVNLPELRFIRPR